MKYVNKLLHNWNPGKIMAAIGYTLGVFFSVLALYSMLFIGHLQESSEAPVFIITPKISAASNIGFGKKDLSPVLFNNLLSLPEVQSTAPILSNSFSASIHIVLGSSRLQTELFLESVGDSYLEYIEDFTWDPENEIVPILISEDFITLYNLAYAPSRGLPLIDSYTIGLIPLEMKISGKGGVKRLQCNIVGSTKRISSILVPNAFMKWANREIGSGTPKIFRGVLETNSPGSSALQALLSQHGAELHTPDYPLKAVLEALGIITFVFTSIGLFIFLLGSLFLAIQLRLTISEQKYNISLLWDLGYKKDSILNGILKPLSFSTVLAVAAGIIPAILFYVTAHVLNIPHPVWLPLTAGSFGITAAFVARFVTIKYITKRFIYLIKRIS